MLIERGGWSRAARWLGSRSGKRHFPEIRSGLRKFEGNTDLAVPGWAHGNDPAFRRLIGSLVGNRKGLACAYRDIQAENHGTSMAADGLGAGALSKFYPSIRTALDEKID